MNLLGLAILLLGAGTLLAARVPVLVALGLPALGVALFGGGSAMAQTLGLQLIYPFNLWNFAGFVIWAAVAALVVESGLAVSWMSSLLRVAGRQATAARLDNLEDSFLGLPLTAVTLLLLAGVPVLPDQHFLVLQMLVVLVPLAVLVGGWVVLSAPAMSQVKLRQMRSTDGGDSWKTTAAATAEVREDGSTRRVQSKAAAWRVLLLPMMLVLGMLAAVVLLPVGLGDLAGPVWVIVLVAGILHWRPGVSAAVQASVPGRFSRIALAGWRTLRLVGVVSANLGGGYLFGAALADCGLELRDLPAGGTGVLLVLALAVVGAAVLGKAVGPIAGAVIMVAVLSPSLALSADASAVAAAAGNILTSLLVGASCLGGLLARLLPPRTQPWPLTATPVA